MFPSLGDGSEVEGRGSVFLDFGRETASFEAYLSTFCGESIHQRLLARGTRKVNNIKKEIDARSWRVESFARKGAGTGSQPEAAARGGDSQRKNCDSNI
jgi:hypothetical protein